MVPGKAKMSAIVERAGIDLISLAVGGGIIRRALLTALDVSSPLNRSYPIRESCEASKTKSLPVSALASSR